MPTAFPRKSFKTVCVDTVLFFAIFALVGHVTINYWERYTIHKELYSMKPSLYVLNDTVGNIGREYDNLHTELKDLLFEVDKKQIHHKDTPECQHKEKLRCKAENNLDKKLLKDLEVQTVLTANKMKIGEGGDTDTRCKAENNLDKMLLKDFEVQTVLTTNKMKIGVGVDTDPHAWINEATGINASTNTKNPPKSTGTSSNISNEEDYLRHGGDATDKS